MAKLTLPERLDLEARLDGLYTELKYSRMAEQGEPVYWRHGPDRPSAVILREIAALEGRLSDG